MRFRCSNLLASKTHFTPDSYLFVTLTYKKRMYFKSDPEVNEFFLWFGEMEFCLAQCEFKSHTRYICPLYLKTAMGISIQGIQDQKINFELS